MTRHPIIDANSHRTYTARCAASAYGTLFEKQAAANSVTGEAVDQRLNSLVNQMAADYPRGGQPRATGYLEDDFRRLHS